ncbi:UPF0489 protein C5orf22 homolog [Cryptotermes secundus]|uniref:UPF0489 protein C5orf22 homolog n=1 Tax=Cryptotermes secundus TaxID=105785 RepID=UPI001454BA56|nr:UPF0489 protein C5orf22 homolog [Cryptotermes secundus]
MFRQYIAREGDPFILDVDLDFFSTRNPFRGLYENADLYSRLQELYNFKRPEDEQDPKCVLKAVQERQAQLSELGAIFEHLQLHRGLQNYQGTSSPRFQSVHALVQEVEAHYPGEQIDWTLVHDAGCTCDDTDLPDHVTTRDDIQQLITTSFAGLLSSLPGPPTIITISR